MAEIRAVNVLVTGATLRTATNEGAARAGSPSCASVVPVMQTPGRRLPRIARRQETREIVLGKVSPRSHNAFLSEANGGLHWDSATPRFFFFLPFYFLGHVLHTDLESR